MIRLSDNLEINKPAPVDDRLGVFVSTASALSSVPEDRRYIGLTVIVDDGSGAVEYWFKDGVTDADLEAKSTGGGGGGVPYTGATQNVDLGEYQLKAGQIELDQSPTGSAGVGIIRWNNDDGTAEIGLKGGNVTLQIGQEQVYEVRNQTGSQILNGTAVYASGVTAGSGRITTAPYTADGNEDEYRFLGLATEDIDDGVNGFVTNFGYVRGLDTRGTSPSSIAVGDETWAVGDILYCHPTVAGKLTKFAPQHEIPVGYIIVRNQSTGIIFVKPSTTGHLEDLHNVNITSPATGQALVYNNSNGLWENGVPTIPTENYLQAGLPYVVYNSSAAAAIATTIDFTINTSQLRNGSTIILQGYMSRASGSGTATFSWTANSNANIASQSFTSGTQYGIQFYWTAKYISGTNSLRFFRTPTTSFVNNTTLATTFFDVVAISGVFTINFRATVTSGSMTGATENLTAQIIY